MLAPDLLSTFVSTGLLRQFSCRGRLDCLPDAFSGRDQADRFRIGCGDSTGQMSKFDTTTLRKRLTRSMSTRRTLKCEHDKATGEGQNANRAVGNSRKAECIQRVS